MIKENIKRKQDFKVPLPKDPLKSYKKGYEDGWSDTINQVMQIVVWTLVDNNLLTGEQVNFFGDRFESTLDMLNDGHITINDIKKTLKKEYDWEVIYH